MEIPCGRGRTRHFARNDACAKRGLRSSLSVIRGAVEIVKLDSNGLSKSIARIGPGKTFGEMALIDGRPRSATVRAVSESTLMILDPEGLASLSDDKPRLALQFVLMIARDLSARLRRTSGMLVDYIGSGA
ncbi:MAG: cyclic nucleotide-binding domain-containing protein [Myxococcales bacterium]|nr:cyclic nucleotide-binding domain-containing protein [Myxococcales bacterium]